MNNVKNIFIIIFCYFSFTAHAQSTVIINDVAWPPYFFIGNKAVREGIAKELLNICIQQAGYKTEFRRLPIKRTHLYMEHGDIDVTIYSYQKPREKFLVYAKESLFSSEYGFMVRADSDIKITNLTDLAPYKIGHLAGLSYTPELMKIIKTKAKNKQLTTGYSLTAMFSQLLAPTPRFDIMADSKITFYWQAKTLGVSDKIKVLDFTIKKKNYFITVSKKSKNIADPQVFLAKTDQCLKELKSNGQYKTLLASYGYKNNH